MTSALASPGTLAGHPNALVVDATVVLPPPELDGPGAASSGAATFRDGHLPGAMHVDLLHELSRPDGGVRFTVPTTDDLRARLNALGLGPATEIVVYDRDRTFWAARLWWMLRGVGHTAARVLDGGWDAWVELGLPIERGPGRAVAPLAPLADGGGWDLNAATGPPAGFVGRADVEAVLEGRRDAHLVCALPRDVYEGRAPGRYVRSGHIPTSTNVPATDLLDATGRLRPSVQLQERWHDVLADDTEIILYCGGGISACLAALSLHELGRDRISVYDGSLEEWSADPALPLVSGPQP